VQVTNPKYINGDIWDKLHVCVRNWFLQRIPEEHQHLVEGVKRSDVQDLLVKYGFWISSTQSDGILQDNQGEDGGPTARHRNI
jgi:hypothetical protein